MEAFFTGEFALEYDSWNESIPMQIDDVDGLQTSTGFQSPEIFIKVRLGKSGDLMKFTTFPMVLRADHLIADVMVFCEKNTVQQKKEN